MATVTFIRNTKQSAGALSGVSSYVSQDKKTDGRRLISGQNCTPQFSVQEFLATRRLHHKDSPVYFYQYVQSFSPEEKITPELAHTIAKEFAARVWPESEVLIATHIDAAHIHTHFIVNAACCQTGRMLRQGPKTLSTIRPVSDEICMKYGLSVISPKQKRPQSMGTREYRSAVKGESWKLRLANTIDECMKYARTKDEFIALMRSEGYEVRWTAERKNITYTCPNGMKCRDDNLHEEKYWKARMEHEFRIRTEIFFGRTEADESAIDGAAPKRADASDGGRDGRAAAEPLCDLPVGTEAVHTDGAVSVPAQSRSPDHGGAGRGDPDTAPAPDCDDRTGWEKERAALFAAEDQTAEAAPEPGMAAAPGGAVGLLGDLSQLGHALERLQDDAPVKDATSLPHRSGGKRRKRSALGHKANDHEDEQCYGHRM